MTMKVPCEIFLRTCGYYAPASRMNKGKQEEHFGDRTFFKVE